MSFADFEAQAREQVRMEPQSWGYRLFASLDAATPAILAIWIQQFLGAAALFSAAALWLMPGSSFDMDLMALKGAISAGLLMLGVAWLRKQPSVQQLEVHIDLLRKEVRLVSAQGREQKLRHLYRFSELGDMTVRNGSLLLQCPKGYALAEVALDPAHAGHR